MKHIGLIPVFLFLFSLLLYAGTSSPLIGPHTHNKSTTPDTVMYSSQQEIDHKDSVYHWVWWSWGTVNAALKIVTYFNDVPGDTLTLDSTSTTAGFQRSKTGITGDSIMDMAWGNWTAYDDQSREWYKQKKALFKYRLFVVVYTGGTDTCAFGVDRYVF